MNLALFDLDNTLIAGDSDFEWAQYLIGRGVLDREVHEARNLEFYEHYKAGTLDIHAFLDFQLAPLARHARAELDAWHREFLATRIRPQIGAAARALVEKHRAAGDLLAIVTATNSFVTGPIARGDIQTVERQRRAIAADAPDLLALFDAMVASTTTLAAKGRVVV